MYKVQSCSQKRPTSQLLTSFSGKQFFSCLATKPLLSLALLSCINVESSETLHMVDDRGWTCSSLDTGSPSWESMKLCSQGRRLLPGPLSLAYCPFMVTVSTEGFLLSSHTQAWIPAPQSPPVTPPHFPKAIFSQRFRCLQVPGPLALHYCQSFQG